MENSNRYKLVYIISMVIYGTVGIFRRMIDLPSALISMLRGCIGTVFLILFFLITRKKPDREGIRKNILPIIASGICIGVNWIFLFESYNYTSVAITTVCLYMGPVFALLASPLFFRTKLSLKQILCILTALAGMVLVSGVLKGSVSISDLKGIFLGLGAAVFYGGIMIASRKTKEIDSMSLTIVQMAIIAVILLPYVLLTVDFGTLSPDKLSLIALAIVCLVHTGIAYVLYLGSMHRIPTSTAAILSYIDPVLAVILSVLVLHETLSVMEWIGVVLVIGAMIASEVHLSGRKKA